jgi:hypothetical protein
MLNYRSPPMPESDPTHLPRADEAWIPDEKLREYSLNANHRRGAPKARVFRAALGLERADWTFLRDQILENVGDIPITGTRADQHGVRYTVVIPILGPNGQTRDVITDWIIERDAPPRLTSAYVSSRRRR